MDAIASRIYLLQLFRQFDLNHDGSIEQHEMVRVLIELGLQPQKWGPRFEVLQPVFTV